MKLRAKDVLERYKREDLPEFAEISVLEVNTKGNFGSYPIHVAAVRGDIEELQALIDGGADVNAPGEMGNRPLHEAAIQGNVEAARLLIQNGARADARNADGQTAEAMALLLGKTEVVAVLSPNIRGSLH